MAKTIPPPPEKFTPNFGEPPKWTSHIYKKAPASYSFNSTKNPWWKHVFLRCIFSGIYVCLCPSPKFHPGKKTGKKKTNRPPKTGWQPLNTYLNWFWELSSSSSSSIYSIFLQTSESEFAINYHQFSSKGAPSSPWARLSPNDSSFFDGTNASTVSIRSTLGTDANPNGFLFDRSFLIGGWTNPSEKYESNWKSSPNRRENKKIFETTT